MGTSLSSLIKNNQIPATAGATILQNALLEIFADGYAYPCQVSDYAATPNLGTAILAATTVAASSPVSTWSQTCAWTSNSSVAQDASGNIYVLAANGGSATGLVCNKYTAAGAFVATLTIDAAATAAVAVNIGVLSNGNLFVTYCLNGVSNKYAIFTQQMVAVQAAALLNNSFTEPWLVSIPLSGGGFAATYATAATTQQISIYNNAGALQNSANVTTDSNVPSQSLAQLSNGNIVMTYSVTSLLKFVIYTTAAAVAVAATSTGITGGYNSSPCAVSVLASGFFALAAITSGATPANAIVYSNAGAAQGGIITSTGSNGLNPLGLVNDGTNFWMVTANGGSTMAPIYTKITSAGVATVVYIGTAYGASTYSNYNVRSDGAGNIFITAGSTTTTKYSTFNVNLLQELVGAATISAGAGASSTLNLIPVGDGAFFLSANSAATAISLSLWKGANTAIIGPAQAAAVAMASVQAVVASGYYPINSLKGTPSKAFTMKSTANLYGNNGAISGIGVALQGM